jgi:hypothetical protein
LEPVTEFRNRYSLGVEVLRDILRVLLNSFRKDRMGRTLFALTSSSAAMSNLEMLLALKNFW